MAKNRKKYLFAVLVAALMSQSAFAEDFAYREAYVPLETEKVVLDGEYPGGYFGSEIAVLDFNDDGTEDLVVAAKYASTGLYDWNGVVSVYYGGDDEEVDVNFFGKKGNDRLGSKLLVKDFNGDGIEDLGMFTQIDGNDDLVYVAYGGKERERRAIDFEYMNADELLDAVNVEKVYRKLDFEVDFDNDGIEEHVGITEFSYPHDKTMVNIIDRKRGERIELIGTIALSFGASIEALDFDNDGYQDLVVGSDYEDTEFGRRNGKVYIFSGKAYPYGDVKEILDPSEEIYTSRGEFVGKILEAFNLREEKEKYIVSCEAYLDFCFFNFMAMSHYSGIELEPELILYPDVRPGDEYYDDVVVGTMLGLVNGYLEEENSPFHPERKVSRIEALKVVLGAADLVPPKYKFELIEILGSYEALVGQSSYFEDINALISHMWWYPRYVNFAVENEIVDEGKSFRPDDPITHEELQDLIEKTLLI